MRFRNLHLFVVFFFNDTATTEIYTLSLHDALPISSLLVRIVSAYSRCFSVRSVSRSSPVMRSEEHTSELQSQSNLVCRLLLEKKKKKIRISTTFQICPCKRSCHISDHRS